jgi:uncharacterized protein
VPHSNPADDRLREIYDTAKVIAVVGASTSEDKPAGYVPAYLQEHGYRIVPVNPGGGEILGEPVVEGLTDITDDVDVVDVFRPAEETPEIARHAAEIGAKVLWLQSGIVSEEAAGIARDAGLTVVMDACMKQTHRSLGLDQAD